MEVRGYWLQYEVPQGIPNLVTVLPIAPSSASGLYKSAPLKNQRVGGESTAWIPTSLGTIELPSGKI
jgi:hypothetical protein